MKSILVDTSGNFLSITIADNNKVLATLFEKIGQKMNEKFLVYLEKLLNLNNIKLSDIDNYFVVVGPGSFTGVRIGVASMLGITTGLNSELKGISSLDAAALSLSDDNSKIAVKLRGNDFVVKEYDFLNKKFSDYKFLNKKDISDDFIYLYEDEIDLSKAILNPMFENFIRDYHPFYMRKSEAELTFDSKSTIN